MTALGATARNDSRSRTDAGWRRRVTSRRSAAFQRILRPLPCNGPRDEPQRVRRSFQGPAVGPGRQSHGKARTDNRRKVGTRTAKGKYFRSQEKSWMGSFEPVGWASPYPPFCSPECNGGHGKTVPTLQPLFCLWATVSKTVPALTRLLPYHQVEPETRLCLRRFARSNA